MKYVASFKKFPRLHEVFLAGHWLASRPRFHRGMIVVCSFLFVLLGFACFFVSTFGDR